MGKKKDVRKKKKRKSMWKVFLVAFIVTLAAGGGALAFILWLGTEDDVPQKEQTLQEIVKVEKEDIPAESLEKKAEKTKQETAKKPAEPAETDDGFDDSGCLRNENGRILEKKQETAGDEATLLFAGDILFDDGYAVMGAMRQRGGIRACFSEETLQEMENADIFMLNNEFTYTNRGEPTPEKQFTFRAKPENAMLLRELGVDIVSLATK